MLTLFVDYEEGWKAYRMYDLVAKRVHVMRDLVFDEHRAWPWTADTTSARDGVAMPPSFTVTYNSDSTEPIIGGGDQPAQPDFSHMLDPSLSVAATP